MMGVIRPRTHQDCFRQLHMLHPFLSAPVRAWRQGAPGEAVDNSICINEKGDIYVEEEPIKAIIEFKEPLRPGTASLAMLSGRSRRGAGAGTVVRSTGRGLRYIVTLGNRC
jgi:hypothetical protein